MHPLLAATAATQGGVFTREQAAGAGYRTPEIRTLLRPGGEWVRLRRGAYVARPRWEAADEVGRWRMRDRAVHLTMRAPHVLSHDSAARALGIDVAVPRERLVHVTRGRVNGTRTEHGVKHHVARTPPGDLALTDGVPHLGAARTAVDLAREHGLTTGVVAMDQALRRNVTVADLRDEIAAQRHWPGVHEARRAVDLADAGAENGGESIARLLVVEALGLRPVTQFPVWLGRSVIWIDMLVGCLAIELDGRVKYLSVAEGGVAVGPVADVVMAEKDREGGLQGVGLAVQRLTPDDFWGEARKRAMARLRQQYAAAVASFGAMTPTALLEAARQMEGLRSERLRDRRLGVAS
jgi:hypothetical protein